MRDKGDPQSRGVVRLVNFAGKAMDEQGKPFPGANSFTFAIYKDQFADDPLWKQTQNATVDADGKYNVQAPRSADGW